MDENSPITTTTLKRRLRLTENEKDALLEAGHRWITQMEGWTYDPTVLRRALDKIEESM